MDFGAIASIAGPVLGAMIGSNSADKASAAQQAATEAAIAEQKRQYDQSRTDLAPWRNAGSAAVSRLSTLLGLGNDGKSAIRNAQDVSPIAQKYFDSYGITDNDWYKIPANVRHQIYAEEDAARAGMSSGADTTSPEYGALNKKFTLADFWDDPVTQASYQFGLDTGTKALNNMAGARGNRHSGAQLKALTRFGTDYTGTKAGESYNRFYGDQDRTFNRLSGVAGTGQTAATNTAQLGAQNAGTVGGLLAAQGNARGAAAIAQGNVWGGAVQNVGNTLSNWWNRQNNPYQLSGFDINDPNLVYQN